MHRTAARGMLARPGTKLRPAVLVPPSKASYATAAAAAAAATAGTRLPVDAAPYLAEELESARIFISPSKYIQGQNVIQKSGKYISRLGKRPLVLADERVWDVAGNDLVHALKQSNRFDDVLAMTFNGEASFEEVDRLAHAAGRGNVDVVVGLGGGKCMDAGKLLAMEKLDCKNVTVPTVASTDAPTSSLSVIYSPSGEFEKYVLYPRNPDLVLVDTAVLCRAPPRFLSSGIGDALATFVESKPTIAADARNFTGGKTTLLGYAIGKVCEETLFLHAEQGLQANAAKVVTKAFDATVTAATLLSGLGFESGGLAAAHAIHNGLTALHSPAFHDAGFLHGEKVAFGIVCQLVFDGRPQADFDRYLSLMARCNLPITLDELLLADATFDDLLAVAEAALRPEESIHNLPYKLSRHEVAETIRAADAYAKSWQARTGWAGRFRLPDRH